MIRGIILESLCRGLSLDTCRRKKKKLLSSLIGSEEEGGEGFLRGVSYTRHVNRFFSLIWTHVCFVLRVTNHLQFLRNHVILSLSPFPPSPPSFSLFLFTTRMFSSSLSSLITKASSSSLGRQDSVIEGCDRHANAVLDLNNMLETRRVGEREMGRGGWIWMDSWRLMGREEQRG